MKRKAKREDMLKKKSMPMKRVTVMITSINTTTTTTTITITSMTMIMMRMDAQVMEFSMLLSMLSTSTNSVNQRTKLVGEIEGTGLKKTRG